MAEAATAEREFPFSERDFRFLSDLVHERTGIVLAEHKRDMVYGRLARRLRVLGYQAFSQYCDLLQSPAGSDEMSQLVNAVTTNLTSFFREPHHFEHLRQQVLPELLQAKKPVRIWSAGCSAGMEPYSIAMVLKEAIGTRQANARVLATDIDSNILDVARNGEYAGNEFEKIPSVYRQYVQRIQRGERIEVAESIKPLVAYKYLNLLEHWPMKGPFDAIFCRNVVIYFDKETKQKLFARMAKILKPGGWLYIGHSENLHNISTDFTLVGRTIYQKGG